MDSPPSDKQYVDTSEQLETDTAKKLSATDHPLSVYFQTEETKRQALLQESPSSFG